VKEYTDQEIIECLKSRQSYVVRWLSDRYLPMIRLLVHQTGGTLDDAKDIFQDGLIVLLEKIDDNDFVLTCKFQTYLYCVCENLWNKILVKRKAAANYMQCRNEENDGVDFTERLDDPVYEKIFYDVFTTLDPACRKILKLYWKEMPPKEIARKLGVTYGYLRKKKCEGQSELIRKVKEHPDYIHIMDSEKVIKDIVH
jgi:RNA polymerase sigma factor (sigma-70 family)